MGLIRMVMSAALAAVALAVVPTSASANLGLGFIDFTPFEKRGNTSPPPGCDLETGAGCETPGTLDELAAIDAPIRARIHWCEVQDPWDPDPASGPSCAREDHEDESGPKCQGDPDWTRWDWTDIEARLALLHSWDIRVEDVVVQAAPQCLRPEKCVGEQKCVPAGDRGLTRWKDFVQRAVNRYGPGGTFWDGLGADESFDIKHWDVWNEPNSKDNWEGDPNVAEYGAVLRRANAAIEGVSAGAANTVAGNVGGTAINFLTELYRCECNGGQGARLSSDRAAFHPFNSQNYQVVVDKTLDVYRIPNIRPLAITAFGWSINEEPEISDKCVGTEEGQARKLANTFDALFDLRRDGTPVVRRAVWFNALDQEQDPTVCPTENEQKQGIKPSHYGLFDHIAGTTYEPKPALCEFSRRGPTMTESGGGRNPALCS